MKNKFHGIVSVILVYSAFILGIVSIFQESLIFGFIALAVTVLWGVPVAWFFCRKCPCRFDCGHVVFGWITRIMPKKEPGPYTLREIIGMLAPVLIVVLFPQYWLWQNKILFGLFWALVTVAGAEIILFICKKCSNDYCPLKK